MLPSSTMLDSTGLDKDMHFYGKSQRTAKKRKKK